MFEAVVSSAVFSATTSAETPTDSYVREGGDGVEGVGGEGSREMGDVDMPCRLGKRDALMLSSSLSE